jgi:ribose transport system substrate-binding protein
VAATSLLASNSYATGPASASPTSKITLEFVPGVTTDPFYITLYNGALAEAKKLGITLHWAGATTWGPEYQTPVLETVLAAHPDGLIVTPTDDRGSYSAIHAFINKHIPVVTVDTTLLNTAGLLSRITSDDYAGGETAARLLAARADGNGTIAYYETTAGNTPGLQRQGGFVAEIKAHYPRIHLVAFPNNTTTDSETSAEETAQEGILANPDLRGIYAPQDYLAAGAGAAVKAEGKSGKITVIGYDAEPEDVKLLREGAIQALVAQRPALEGQLAVEYEYDYLTGRGAEVPKSYKTPNVLMTKANIKDPSISQYIYASKPM